MPVFLWGFLEGGLYFVLILFISYDNKVTALQNEFCSSFSLYRAELSVEFLPKCEVTHPPSE